MENLINKIICGESADILNTQFPAECIDMVLCSPPYDIARSYNGFEFNFEMIADQLSRVLKPGGVIVWVVADSTIKGSETGTSFRQALYFKNNLHLNIHDTMIYQKTNPIPLTHNRYEQSFEYMFVFSKGKPKTFNPIMEQCKHEGNIKIRNSTTASSKDVNHAFRENGRTTTIKKEKIKPNIWSYSVGSGKSSKDNLALEHPAVMPEQLAIDNIRSWTNEQDIVLDPFSGSGTTCIAAKKLNRNYIGIDISKEYCDLAQKRLNNVSIT